MLGQKSGVRNRWRRVVLAVALVLAGLLLPVAPASAAPCSDAQNNPVLVGGFEIDGNLCHNTTGTVGQLDWDTTGTQQPVITDPQGSSDGSAFSGTSENQWPWTVPQTSGTNPAGNADITHVFGYSRIVNEQVFAYFGWQRAATQGTVGFYVELNQKPNLRGPVPDRTDGDLRLRFIQQGSSLLQLDAAYLWSSTGPTSGVWNQIPVAGYQARVNATAVSNLPGLSPNPMPAGTFAEAAVDVSGLFAGAGECGGQLAYMNLRSVSSLQATNPPLQDWVAPVRLGVPPTCPTVVLQKHWLNGADGDTAALAIDGATTAPGAATSTAGGQADFLDTGHRATAEIKPGTSVSLDETLAPGNTGTYTSQLACDTGPLTTPVPGTSGSFTVPSTAGAGDTITCTFTNTRTSALLTLTKNWSGATAGDSFDLSIQADHTTAGPTTSTAPASTTITQTVLSGEGVTVGESPGNANAASYQATTACTGVDGFTAGDFGGSFTVPATPGPMSCTITNTAIPAQLTLLKSWVRGAAGDTAELTVSDPTTSASAVATVPAGGSGDSVQAASLPITPGDTVTLAEALPASGRTNAGIYLPASLTCNGQPVPFSATSTATSATATASYTVASSAPVTCVVTNHPRYRVLLSKVWGANAVSGDTADLTVTNTTTGDVGTQQALAPQPPATPASVIADGGDDITLSESLTGQGTYAASLDCNHGARAVAGGTSGTLRVPSNLTAGTAILCTFTNTARYRVTLTKAWVGALAGDTAALTVDNVTSGETAGPTTATAPHPPSPVPAVTASARDIVDVREALIAADRGVYEAVLTCSTGSFRTRSVTDFGEFEVPDDLPAGTTIACEITNTRTATHPPTVIATPHVRTATSRQRVTPGRAFRDRIHVSGLGAGRHATAVGRLFGPFSSPAAATCSPAHQVRSRPLRVRDGWTTTPPVRVRAPGVYTWRVTVLAGAGNRSATHRCGEAVETTVVAKSAYAAPEINGGFSGTIEPSASYRAVPIRISLPAIGLDAPVVSEGIAGGEMTLPDDVHAVGWLRNSASVGDRIGTTVIGGHVSDRHDRPGALVALSRARAGQRVTVVRGGVRHVYRIVSTATFLRGQALPQRDVTTTGRPRLVLVSCTDEVVRPDGHFHYQRFVVVVAREVRGS